MTAWASEESLSRQRNKTSAAKVAVRDAESVMVGKTGENKVTKVKAIVLL